MYINHTIEELRIANGFSCFVRLNISLTNVLNMVIYEIIEQNFEMKCNICVRYVNPSIRPSMHIYFESRPETLFLRQSKIVSSPQNDKIKLYFCIKHKRKLCAQVKWSFIFLYVCQTLIIFARFVYFILSSNEACLRFLRANASTYKYSVYGECWQLCFILH